MVRKVNIRWAVNARAWMPTTDEILLASGFIQSEEKQRIARYVFQDDAKSSLLGRLMLRKFVHIATNIPYDEIKFGRDDHGKPYLIGHEKIQISFNVSHQGDYVVFAGNTNKKIGIDVMKIEPPVHKNVPEFFRLMKRQFSKHEWNIIHSYPSEMEQIACFYRIWCLKESFVKNIGVGITVPLHELSFSLKTYRLGVGQIYTDTTLYEKETPKQDYLFEETLLDDRHTVSVCVHVQNDYDYTPAGYIFLSFGDVVKEGKPVSEADAGFADNFMKKQIKFL